MAEGAERREARRFNMSLPMRVLPSRGNQPELNAHTRDVSYRGLYFLTDTRFEIGAEIEFVITLPKQISQTGEVNIRCHGEIVRVEKDGGDRMGIAAKIQRYEFVPVTATAA